MSENKVEIPAKFRIFDIKLNSFQEFKPKVEIPKKFNNFTFEVSVSSRINLELSLIEINVKVGVYVDKEKSHSIAVIDTISIFEVINLNEIIKNENQLLKIPEILILSLIGISISTTRGMLIAKTSGSLLQNAFIPVINPSDFLKENSSFVIPETSKTHV